MAPLTEAVFALIPSSYFAVFFFEGLEKELADQVAATAALQIAFDDESQEHMALQRTIRSLCDALDVDGGESDSMLQSGCGPSTPP